MAEAARGAKRLSVVLVALLYIALWSTSFVAIKIGVRSSPPLTLLTLRFILAAALMAPLVRGLGHRWPDRPKVWLRLGIVGVLNLGLPATLNFIALKHASASAASLLLVANPMLLALVAPRLLGEHLGARRAIGLLIGFGGVVFVMYARLRSPGRADTPLGLGLLLAAVVSMVGATVIFKRFPPKEPLLVVNVAQQIASALLLLPAALLLEDPRKLHLSTAFLGSLGYLVVVVSVVAGLLWFWLLSRGEASIASSYLFLVPIAGILCASIVLDERFGARDAIGLVIVTTGIALMQARPPAR